MRTLFFLLALFLVCCSTDNRKDETVVQNDITKINSLIVTLKQNDDSLGAPQIGDWLASHIEEGQTFNEYVDSKPVSANEIQHVIYLQPIGKFDSVQTRMINYTQEYLEIFFGLKTVIQTTITDDIIHDSARRIGGSEQEQLLAPYILNEILAKNKPEDAVCIMAITEKDLYPEFSWNFVFGLSYLWKRVGVTSVFRFSDWQVTDMEYQQFLDRLIKVSSHEIGHMFSIKHCINAQCLMNGSNSMSETDGKPNRLCSVCNGKLCWNLKLDPLERAKKMANFFKKHRLELDREKALADIKILEQNKNHYMNQLKEYN